MKNRGGLASRPPQEVWSFAAATLLAAALLFMVQPLAARILLPVLGGGPAVWSTSLLFFQVVLLGGYVYAHVLATWMPPRWQPFVHIGVLAAASLALPLSSDVGGPGASDPRWWTLSSLARLVGLPFLALAATAPLLQRWFSRTDLPGAGDPYFLYATSNAGSLLGLAAVPLLEPFSTRSSLAAAWSVLFWATAVIVSICALRATALLPIVATEPMAADEPLPRRRWLAWVALAAVPSALLLGVTQHIATDIVSAPLLWVVPLALYLLTFVAAFAGVGGQARAWGRVAPVAALLVLGLSLAEVRAPVVPVTLVHMAAFAVLAMMCHCRLAADRPAPVRLTTFYLCISAGGALGGLAVALVAPSVFSSILEYPLAIAAALLLRPQVRDNPPVSGRARWMWPVVAAVLFVLAWRAVVVFDAAATVERPSLGGIVTWIQAAADVDAEHAIRLARAALVVPALVFWLLPRQALSLAGIAAGLLLGAATVRTGGDVLHRERTFFGMHQVTSIQGGAWHVLTHGTTTHGIQATGGRVRQLPTAYYHPSGPVGDLVFALSGEDRFRDVAVIGLGAGALAGYAGERTRMDFFEIDAAVIRIAEDPRFFTYLADARARPGTSIRTEAADGRLALQAAEPASYDAIVIDAFSSDAIPVHLMTREAVDLYTSRLKPRGVIAFHVSSRFFDLQPVLSRIAAAAGLVAYGRDDVVVPPERADEGMRPSSWIVFARNSADVGQIARATPRWRQLTARADQVLWTDDYTNVIGALLPF